MSHCPRDIDVLYKSVILKLANSDTPLDSHVQERSNCSILEYFHIGSLGAKSYVSQKSIGEERRGLLLPLCINGVVCIFFTDLHHFAGLF